MSDDTKAIPMLKPGVLSFAVECVRRKSISKRSLAVCFTPLLVTSVAMILLSPVFLMLSELAGNVAVLPALAFGLALIISLCGAAVFAAQMELAKMSGPGWFALAVMIFLLWAVPYVRDFSFLSKANAFAAWAYLGGVWVARRSGREFSLIPEDFVDD